MYRLVVLAALLLAVCPRDAEADDFKRARATYRKEVRSKSLAERTIAREKFARAHGVRALAMIASDYAKPRDPIVQDRALIASILGLRARTDEGVAVLDSLRQAHATRQDAWLWYQYTRSALRLRGYKVALVVIEDRNVDPFLRAAAIEALVDSGAMAPRVLESLASILGDLPDGLVARTVLVESGARLLWSRRSELKSEAFDRVVALVIKQMARRDAPQRTRLTLARYLQRIFKTKGLHLDPGRWLALLDWNRTGGEGRYAPPVWRPTFAGIPATGSRIAYVIDNSSSMGSALTAGELEELRGVPASGLRPPPPIVTGRPSKKAKNTGAAVSLRTLPWELIRTRSDFAREFLKRSIRMLRTDQEFVIVRFATESRFLRGFQGPVKATRANVKRACRELDRHGVSGGTCLHGGLRMAFRSVAGRLVDGDPGLVSDALLQGCETIYLLSDGHPTVDELEGATKTARAMPFFAEGLLALSFEYADYTTTFQIVDDIRRMNLFRKCEIHCVGIGEANRMLLGQLARDGDGMLRLVGDGGVSTAPSLPRMVGGEARVAELAVVLQGMLRTNADGIARANAAEQLGLLACAESAALLIESLADTEEGVRQASLCALARISGLNEDSYLLPPRADEDVVNRVQAAWRNWLKANGQAPGESVDGGTTGAK